jgi:hypothetical protein
MTIPRPPTASKDTAGPRSSAIPLEAGEREPTWVADDLHLLRLVCQITDYEVGATTYDDWAAVEPGVENGATPVPPPLRESSPLPPA